MSKQGEGNKDVTKAVVIPVPSDWGELGLDADQLTQLGRYVATARGRVRGQVSTAFGDGSSTYDSRGKIDDKHTVRTVVILGKELPFQVTPITPARAMVRPYMMCVDLWQNYARSGESALFGIWLDFSVLILSAPETVKHVLCGMCGESEETYTAAYNLAKTTVDYANVLGAGIEPGLGVFVKSSTATKEAKAKTTKTVPTDEEFATLFAK